MNLSEFRPPEKSRRPGIGLVLIALLIIVIVAGWLIWPDSFFPAYWFGLMFWTQLSVGCLVLLLVQFLTGGKWGEASAPLLRGGAGGLYILLPLFLPVFFALPHIFSWTHIQVGVSSMALVRKRIWLNPAAFIIRAAFFLGILTALTRYWCRPGLSPRSRVAGWSGPALVCVIVVLSFASSDWMMSIEPSFYSSLYPFMYFADAMVVSLALICGTLSWFQLRGIMSPNLGVLHDLGQLLFSAVLFWGYIVFSQFIIIWTGNLPDEADWYVVRSTRGWQWLTNFVILFHFAVPFCLLLSQKLKRDPRRFLRFCCVLFVIHFAELFWLMEPQKGSGIYLNPFDIILPALIGACWFWFIGDLRNLRPVPAAPSEPAA